jgi:HK97 gp10 family phage protein
MVQSGIRVNLRNNIGRVEGNLGRAARGCLEQLGGFIVSQAKLRCPVDTGYLRGSIGYEVRRHMLFKHRLIIYSRAEYSVFVHEGTRRMRPRRFLTDTVLENLIQIRSFIREHFRSSFR